MVGRFLCLSAQTPTKRPKRGKGRSVRALMSPSWNAVTPRVLMARIGIATPENWDPTSEMVSPDQSFRNSRSRVRGAGPGDAGWAGPPSLSLS